MIILNETDNNARMAHETDRQQTDEEPLGVRVRQTDSERQRQTDTEREKSVMAQLHQRTATKKAEEPPVVERFPYQPPFRTTTFLSNLLLRKSFP